MTDLKTRSTLSLAEAAGAAPGCRPSWEHIWFLPDPC
jgi:hypothetical protein